MLDNEQFFRSGLTEVSVRIGESDTIGNPDRLESDLYSMIDDLITGTSNLRMLRYIPEYQSIHGWMNIPTPRVVTLQISQIGSINAYVEGGKSVTVSIDPESGDYVFGGDLGKINNELAAAPAFNEADRLTKAIETGSLSDPAEARRLYEKAFDAWNDSVNAYIADANLSEVGKRIIYLQPKFQRAYWMMLHENFLGLKTYDDYSALREAMTTEDNYLLAQKWFGGLVKNLASSELTKRLADNIRQERDSILKGAIMKYMRRYDALGIFLGINGMPKLAQMAVARTLCAGGFLKRAKSKEEAIAIADTIASSYIPDPEIRRIVEEYARHLYHDDFKKISDSPEGVQLRELLSKYKGRYVVLDFWNYRCPPCIREMRDTRAIRELHRGNPDWVILYVTGDEVTPREHYEKTRMKYLEGDETVSLQHSVYGRISAMFDLQEVPRKILFDREGNIVDERYKLNFDQLNGVDK